VILDIELPGRPRQLRWRISFSSAGAGCCVSTARQSADLPKIYPGAASDTETAGCALATELGRLARIRNVCAAAPSLGALAACALQASCLRARARV